MCYGELFFTYRLYWTGFNSDSWLQHSWVSADRQITICFGRVCHQSRHRQAALRANYGLLWACQHRQGGGPVLTLMRGRQRAVWGDDQCYLDRSQSGCILPVLAQCCTQTNRLWILSRWQADWPPHQQPVFPTGKRPPVAKGRAFRETTKFHTHMIHVANDSRKPKKQGAFTTDWDRQVAELPPPPAITYTAHLQRSRGWWATFASWAGQTREQLSLNGRSRLWWELYCTAQKWLCEVIMGVVLILPITYSNYSLQSVWPVASKRNRSTLLGM